jgi:hypothetical protein
MLHVFYDCISFRIYLYWTDNFVLKLANNFLTLQIQIAGKVVGCNLIGKRMKAWLEIGCTRQGNGMGIQIKKRKYKQNKKTCTNTDSWKSRWVQSDWKKDESLAGDWVHTAGKWNGDPNKKT